MRDIVDIQKQLLPDMMDILKKRHAVLRHIMVTGKVGRRALASSVDITERVLRSEIEFLKTQGLVDIESIGITISEAGKQLLEQLEPFMKELFGLNELEERIKEIFQMKQVMIVPGDSDESIYTKKELGRAGAAVLKKYISKGDVIAVTGGSTMAEVANHLTASSQLKKNLFVPARGGLGERVELQANTIASIMASRTGGEYRLLHVPDHFSDETYHSLVQEPNIIEMIEVIRSSRMVIHGIGDAMVMAKRRKVDEQTIEHLIKEKALAEAFGYYFDRHGNVVHKIATVGLRLEDIQNKEVVIGVAGGKSKAEAICSILRYGHDDVIVLDEAAALEILVISTSI